MMSKKWIWMTVVLGIAFVGTSIALVGCGDAVGGKVTLRGGNQ